MTLSDEQIQDLLRVGNPTNEECRLIRMGWDAAMREKNAMSVPDEIERLQSVVTRPHNMTRDDIIRVAREAGISDTAFDFQMVIPEDLERFASLVAAAEREACAQLVEKNADVCGPNTMLCDVLRGNAAAIRARCCDAP